MDFFKKNIENKHNTRKVSNMLLKMDVSRVTMARYGLKLSQDRGTDNINLLET